jgi:hypothetical protein
VPGRNAMTTADPHRYQRKSPEQLDAEREERGRQRAAERSAYSAAQAQPTSRQTADPAWDDFRSQWWTSYLFGRGGKRWQDLPADEIAGIEAAIRAEYVQQRRAAIFLTNSADGVPAWNRPASWDSLGRDAATYGLVVYLMIPWLIICSPYLLVRTIWRAITRTAPASAPRERAEPSGPPNSALLVWW